MCGNNLTYEPSFVEQNTQKNIKQIMIDQKCKVSPVKALGAQSINDLSIQISNGRPDFIRQLMK